MLKAGPPSANHRVICCYYPEIKDHNQLKNIALRVGDPTGLLPLNKPGKTGKFTGFIEMKTQAEAAELLSQVIADEPNCDASWAKGIEIDFIL